MIYMWCVLYCGWKVSPYCYCVSRDVDDVHALIVTPKDQPKGTMRSVETVLKVEHSTPGPLPKCIDASADAGTHRQVITTQLYLKEVGSDNAGAPAHHSRHAHVPPYPTGVRPANPFKVQHQAFYRPRACAAWHHSWCHMVTLRCENMM